MDISTLKARLLSNGEVREEFNEDNHYVGLLVIILQCLSMLHWIVTKVICSCCIMGMRHVLNWFEWQELCLNQILQLVVLISDR